MQQGVPGRHYATHCRVEIVPLSAEAVKNAVERLGSPQNEQHQFALKKRKINVEGKN